MVNSKKKFMKSQQDVKIWEKVKTYTNPEGYQPIQDHGNQPIQIPM